MGDPAGGVLQAHGEGQEGQGARRHFRPGDLTKKSQYESRGRLRTFKSPLYCTVIIKGSGTGTYFVYFSYRYRTLLMFILFALCDSVAVPSVFWLEPEPIFFLDPGSGSFLYNKYSWLKKNIYNISYEFVHIFSFLIKCTGTGSMAV